MTLGNGWAVVLHDGESASLFVTADDHGDATAAALWVGHARPEWRAEVVPLVEAEELGLLD